ncbi:MAG: hypothetical protein EOM87_06700, partial [Clostridia bacterium]|nr:hypothetical protein [Clostridia bacterium]
MKKIIITFSILVLAVLLALCFCSCDKLALEQTGNITYDGSTVKWDKVTGAEEYKIVINGGEEKTVSSTAYSFSDKTLDSITVSITAISGEKKIGNGEVATKTFVKLASIDTSN